MTPKQARNRAHLTALFGGEFPGHALWFDGPWAEAPEPGDYAVSSLPLTAWRDSLLRTYEGQLAWHEALDDESVPYVKLGTGTELFAAAFGCEVHVYPDSPPAARPLVRSAAEAEALAVPRLSERHLARVFEMGALMREALGPDVPLGVPDIQSPFDVAALIWNKEDLYVAVYEQPDAVHRLVDKCEALLTAFWDAFRGELGEVNFCHCPTAWAPPEMGVWLSEDEAGCLSAPMFARFCRPTLERLSARYGGLFMHCCATADHQYDNFAAIPGLRALNRVFQQPPGEQPAIDRFGATVFMVAWAGEAEINRLLGMARPETRFLFNVGHMPLDAARGCLERLRVRCPRTG
jgi:hypothetical protein